MKNYKKLKADMVQFEMQMVETKQPKRIDVLKKVRGLCNEYGFAASMLKSRLAQERVKI